MKTNIEKTTEEFFEGYCKECRHHPSFCKCGETSLTEIEKEMKWKSIEKDGKPTEDGDYLVRHEEFYWFSIQATYHRNEFTIGPQNVLLPATLPIVVTHYVCVNFYI